MTFPTNTEGIINWNNVYSDTIDFGSERSTLSEFTVSNGLITPSSKIYAWVSDIIGRPKDELGVNPIAVTCIPGTGSMTVYAKPMDSVAYGEYTLLYNIL